MGIFSKVKSALSRTAAKFSGIKEVFTKKKIDLGTLDELTDQLLLSDFGVETTGKITSELKKLKFSKESTSDEYLISLKKIIKDILINVEKPLQIQDGKLNIILVCGVNGNGKTTSIAKIANFLKNNLNKKVVLAACDTFRAAAIEQLKVWSDRVGCEIIENGQGSDPASVVYKAVSYSLDNKADILIIDTAGRLHNQINLMAELEKIINVIRKKIPDAPHEIILTLDSTTGQNLNVQLENFKYKANITGLILTKLDGTAKGGAIIGISDKFKLPIYFLGIGEKLEDLLIFKSDEFVDGLF